MRYEKSTAPQKTAQRNPDISVAPKGHRRRAGLTDNQSGQERVRQATGGAEQEGQPREESGDGEREVEAAIAGEVEQEASQNGEARHSLKNDV